MTRTPTAVLLRSLLACLLTFGLPDLGRAATLNVPAQYLTIQAGVNAAANGDTVLVADGTYTGNGNRDIDLNGKNITVTSQHGPASTIIDCGGSKTTDGSGSHRGFYIHSGEIAATISGFTVKNGYETGVPGIPNSGAGGGIFVNNSGAGTITLTNCTVSGNTAYYGGGVSNENGNTGTITLTNCTVSGNTATGYGGGVSNFNNGSGTITLTNCTVSGNTAPSYGGVYNYSFRSSGTITLTNCLCYQNTGGEIANAPTTAVSAIAAYSDILGGYTGTGNIDKDPLFVSKTDLHLKSGSPCLGAGTATGAPTTTIDGKIRPNPPSIGAYELAQPVASPASATHVLWDNTNGQASIWNYATTDGTFTQNAYGPYAGWTA